MYFLPFFIQLLRSPAIPSSKPTSHSYTYLQLHIAILKIYDSNLIYNSCQSKNREEWEFKVTKILITLVSLLLRNTVKANKTQYFRTSPLTRCKREQASNYRMHGNIILHLSFNSFNKLNIWIINNIFSTWSLNFHKIAWHKNQCSDKIKSNDHICPITKTLFRRVD